MEVSEKSVIFAAELIFKHMKYYVETKTLGHPWAIERTFDTYESAKRYVNNMRGFLALSNTKIRISQ